VIATWLRELPWMAVVVGCLTLGLAPFTPPHIVEKLQMLSRGELTRPIDIFDLLFHSVPWLLAVAKAVVVGLSTRASA
jgi:hypothetical protein